MNCATHAYDINSFLKPRGGEKFNRIVIKFCISFPSFIYSPGRGYDVIWEEGLPTMKISLKVQV